MKPGYKTTEFWLAVFVTLLGMVAYSGVIADGGTVAKGIGLLMGVLPAPAYSFGRAKEKAAAQIAGSNERITEAHIKAAAERELADPPPG